jgi:hypothetical protein
MLTLDPAAPDDLGGTIDRQCQMWPRKEAVVDTDEIESKIDALNIAIKQMEDELAKVEELEKALGRLHDVEFHRERDLVQKLSQAESKLRSLRLMLSERRGE